MRHTLFNILLILGLFLASFSPAAVSAVEAQGSTPTIVNIPGTHQDELGCPGEWQPACEATLLTYDIEDDVWQGTYEIQPANDDDKKGPRYKVALNGGWGENYGLNATQNGPDIPLVVSEPTLVKFYYDHKTHWIADNFNKPIIVAMGDFQKQIGCFNDNDATCLRAWLQDPDGDGLYDVTVRGIKTGTYTVTFTLNEDANNVIGEPQSFTVTKDGDAVYFGYDSVKNQFTISATGAPVGNLNKQRAIWIAKDTLLWRISGGSGLKYALVYSPEAALELSPQGILNGSEIPLTFVAEKPSVDILREYPHLRDYAVFQLTDTSSVAEILKGQVAVVARTQAGKDVDATGVQIPGVLDDVYQYDGPLGVTFEGGVPTLRVWAPTAQSVTLHLFDTEKASYANKIPMQWDASTGVWSVTGEADWKGKYYLYEVKVFAPATGKIETNLVTDPYSLSLSMNSQRSQIVDLNDASLKPEGWDTLVKPPLATPEDIVIYELHIRDFSVSDATVPAEWRGTYKAFTVKDSNGMKHLASLAEAGLTHIHLLPAFDIASVNEDKSTWQSVDEEQLKALPPDSDGQSIAVSAIAGADGFNWGYDPLHYTTPDGSYATDPNGAPRILEFREMVQALNQSGLRVIMDVVYNHTNASGQSPNSVLDRVVPGYYHRLNADGNVEKSTCCENTATEHNMMRKLMIDSVVTWAKQYKVDGFRFDLMGHHMLEDMLAVRAALDALTLEKDGVDGKAIYIYGEGWNFGEVANNARGKNATQLNIAGSGIGVFNDRLRDAVRGGNPFDDVRLQGFATGLVLTNNTSEKRSAEDQQITLNNYTDWIRLGLAGNLAGYEIVRADGNKVPGRLVSYNGSPAGYTADPQENIVYVSAHDNHTLFDAVQVKAPAEATLQDRIRMNNLALSVVMFSQGVPFFHAGDDILRSKSFDPNSYNSGDWYNKLDWTYESNNFGVGLPIEGSGQWDIYKPLLADPKLVPAKTDITFASAVFREFLQIRKSSPLFRLQTADQIKQSLTFLNTGPQQTPGLIVMRLQDTSNLDPNFSEIIVLFNARPEAATFSDASLAGNYVLHAVQQKSVDEVVKQAAYANGAFSVPARTTAVFVIERAKPAPEAPTEAAPAETPAPNNAILLFGVIAAILALLGLGVFLRRKKA
ncbi:MAG: pullulanase-type alpha-1,6-glucosidase [Chloroflexota bacterium]|nr:pullulanase-type alpha-1,6-glucosidase [Chloroflexota bacterium]MBI5702321.1 pullulanase-type alpha-1,6-glucosidase [Chloroflexota bacterium]